MTTRETKVRKRDNDGGTQPGSNQNNANDSLISSHSSNIPNRSVSSGNGHVGNQGEALRRMSKLVNSLFSRNDCAPFREPVDWRGLELWDYPKIIKKMMDLGTVKRKLERGQYDTALECANDIRLIWKNCITYNADGSDFFLLAEAFSKRFEDRYKKIRQEFDTGENTSSSNTSSAGGEHSKGNVLNDPVNSSVGAEVPSLDAKTMFGANLFRLTGVQLGHVLQVLDIRCPRALERPTSASWGHSNPSDNCNGNNISGTNDGDEEIEVNVDAMDPTIFYELDSYVREKVLSNRNSVANKDGIGNGATNQRQYFAPSAGEQSLSGTGLSGSLSGDSIFDGSANTDLGKKIANIKGGKRKR